MLIIPDFHSLKQYLQALPTPLLNDKLWRLFTTACLNSTRPLEKRIESAQLILQLLPTKHFNLLLYLAAGFSQLPLFPKNAVSIDKVASIFGDALFGLRTPTQQRHSIKRFGMTITAPSELLSDGRNQAGSATAALRWLLAHWAEIAEGLLAEDCSPRRSARPLSTETLDISTATASPTLDVDVTGEEHAKESDVVASAAEMAAPEAETSGSEPALSLSSSATASPKSPSVSTPPDPPSPLLSPEDEREAHAALEKQLDDAIALLTVRRPSAESTDSQWHFPSDVSRNLALTLFLSQTHLSTPFPHLRNRRQTLRFPLRPTRPHCRQCSRTRSPIPSRRSLRAYLSDSQRTDAVSRTMSARSSSRHRRRRHFRLLIPQPAPAWLSRPPS